MRIWPKIKDPYRKRLLVLLENQEKAMREQASQGTFGMITENPTNNTGDVTTIQDPVLISMIRHTMPNLSFYMMFVVFNQ